MMTWEAAVRWLRENPEHADLARECYFDLPLREAAMRFRRSSEWAATREWIPDSPGRALDLGAGNGIASYALAADGWETFAVEPDPSGEVGALAVRMLADSFALPIHVVRQRGEHLPFRDSTFDLVYGRQVLHHAGDLEQMCREAFRVLQPGGVFVAVREHVVSSPSQLRAFLGKHPLQPFYGGEAAYPQAAYRRALQGAGFAIRSTYRAFDTPVNLAPFTRATLRLEVRRRVTKIPVAGGLLAPLISDSTFPALLRLLSWIDRRPGRLVSFVAEKGY